MHKRRFLYFASGCIFLIILCIVAFYGRYELLSNYLEDDFGYKGSEANAIKHTYAAAQLYGALENVIGADNAESVVINLGLLNEYAETITKFSKPDSPEEIMKDLHNNFAGISAVKWRNINADHHSLMEAVFILANTSVLINSKNNIPFSTEGFLTGKNRVKEGHDWVVLNQNNIRERVFQTLEGHRNDALVLESP